MFASKRLFLVLAVVDHKRINNNKKKKKKNYPERHATDKTKTFIHGKIKSSRTIKILLQYDYIMIAYLEIKELESKKKGGKKT